MIIHDELPESGGYAFVGGKLIGYDFDTAIPSNIQEELTPFEKKIENKRNHFKKRKRRSKK